MSKSGMGWLGWYGVAWGYDGDWGMMAIVSAGGLRREANIKAGSMLQSESRSGSVLQAKCQQFHVSIRNEQIHSFRSQKRQ
jgi:hypothetical protein